MCAVFFRKVPMITRFQAIDAMQGKWLEHALKAYVVGLSILNDNEQKNNEKQSSLTVF
jgi:hypothetical protein